MTLKVTHWCRDFLESLTPLKVRLFLRNIGEKIRCRLVNRSRNSIIRKCISLDRDMEVKELTCALILIDKWARIKSLRSRWEVLAITILTKPFTSWKKTILKSVGENPWTPNFLSMWSRIWMNLHYTGTCKANRAAVIFRAARILQRELNYHQ